MSRQASEYTRIAPTKFTLYSEHDTNWRGTIGRQCARAWPSWNWNNNILPAPVCDVVAILDRKFFTNAPMRLFLNEGEDGAILVLYCPECFDAGSGFLAAAPAKCERCGRSPGMEAVQAMRLWRVAGWKGLYADEMIEMAKATDGWNMLGSQDYRPREPRAWRNIRRVRPQLQPLTYGGRP